MSASGLVRDYFDDENEEIDYSGIKIKPCLFQDDVATLAIDLKSVQKGNDKVEALAESKLLDYNHEKSSMLILGSRKFQKKINDELKSNPIIF